VEKELNEPKDTKRRLIKDDERDYDLARRIDAEHANSSQTFGAVIRMEPTSPIARGIHAGMTKKSVFAEPDPNAIAMPTKHSMTVERRPLPPPEKKHPQGVPQGAEVTEDSEKLAETKKLLDVANRRIEIKEREKQELRDIVEKRDQAIANLKSEIKNTPSELKTLLEFLHYDTVELLIKDVNAYKVYLQKSRARKERYEARHYG
jgi:hypothetical protein